MQIIARELSYSYSAKSLSVKALNKINLSINEGDFYGIIGKTGSGKSTFVQHINGLIKVQKNSGSLVCGEYNLAEKKCDYKSLRKKVGMIFQYPEYQLFAETVYEDVAFGLKNFDKTITSEEIDKKVKKAIEIVGLNYDRVKGKSPFELSGGQKRRVAIAGVIVTEPEVLVLDEPVAGLDPQGKREFFALLHQLHKSFVKTIVLVTHDMNLVTENCNRGAIFDNGKVVLEGTPKELFNNSEILLEAGLELPVVKMATEKVKKIYSDFNCELTTTDFIEKFSKLYFDKKGGNR